MDSSLKALLGFCVTTTVVTAWFLCQEASKWHKQVATKNWTIDSLKNVLAHQQPEIVSKGNIMGWEMAQFLSANKETGIPQAMIDLLASDERFGLEIHEGSELPSFIQWKVRSYANQNHALLTQKHALAANERNPEGIVAFFDLTSWNWWPWPMQLIVYSQNKNWHEEWCEIQKLIITPDNKLKFTADSKLWFTAKEIINQAYVE